MKIMASRSHQRRSRCDLDRPWSVVAHLYIHAWIMADQYLVFCVVCACVVVCVRARAWVMTSTTTVCGSDSTLQRLQELRLGRKIRKYTGKVDVRIPPCVTYFATSLGCRRQVPAGLLAGHGRSA